MIVTLNSDNPADAGAFVMTNNAPGNDSERAMRGHGTLVQNVVMPRCPATGRHPSDLIGCGSGNVTGPDAEGLYDCLDCGLFFRAEAV